MFTGTYFCFKVVF